MLLLGILGAWLFPEKAKSGGACLGYVQRERAAWPDREAQPDGKNERERRCVSRSWLLLMKSKLMLTYIWAETMPESITALVMS